MRIFDMREASTTFVFALIYDDNFSICNAITAKKQTNYLGAR